MADEAKVDTYMEEWMKHVKKLDDANSSFYEKVRKDTEALQTKMEALAGTNLASYPTFRPFVGIGKILAAIKTSDIDREIILGYLDSLVAAGTPAKADAIRVAVRAAIPATVGG